MIFSPWRPKTYRYSKYNGSIDKDAYVEIQKQLARETAVEVIIICVGALLGCGMAVLVACSL